MLIIFKIIFNNVGELGGLGWLGRFGEDHFLVFFPENPYKKI